MITTPTHVYFYSGKQCFSNWHHFSKQISMQGLTFESSEQAFMFLKADFFRDFDIAAAAHQETDPSKVKSLGRLVKGYNDAEWETVREGFMTFVNLLKFRQNPEMLTELLKTQNRILVEASPYDKIWGVGLTENDPSIVDETKWLGRNLLGKSLMKVRELLQMNNQFSWNPAHPLGTCARCGEEMVYNIPRLGADGGFVHKETRQLLCADQENDSTLILPIYF